MRDVQQAKCGLLCACKEICLNIEVTKSVTKNLITKKTNYFQDFAF